MAADRTITRPSVLMIDGTQEDWDIIAREQKEFAPQNGKRILDHLKLLGGGGGSVRTGSSIACRPRRARIATDATKNMS